MADVKIHGIDGMTVEEIRKEVEGGARLVQYIYVISIFVMTFKRGSDIYFIRAGRSPVFPGLPCTFLTLFFGWWGFPWGPLYSLEALFKNLSGGIDLTHDWMLSTRPSEPPKIFEQPRPAHPTPPTQPAQDKTAFVSPLERHGNTAQLRQTGMQSYASSPATNPPEYDYSKPRKKPLRAYLIPITVLAVLVTVGVCVRPLYLGFNHRVFLVNGLDQSYSIIIDGEAHEVPPGTGKELSLTEGKYEVSAKFPATNQPTFFEKADIRTPFCDRMFGKEKITFINPDKLALIYREKVYYSVFASKDIPPGGFVIFPNKSVLHMTKPDFVLQDFPSSVDLPRDQVQHIKERVAIAGDFDIYARLQVIQKEILAEATDYAARIAAFNIDAPNLFESALEAVPEEERQKFFESQLNTRPVFTEWHRKYQDYLRATGKRAALEKYYRSLLDNEPNNGALLYLYGRAISIPGESEQYYKKSLNAPTPCPYAWLALAWEQCGAGNFPEGLKYIEEARAAGFDAPDIHAMQRTLFLATGQQKKALDDIAAEFEKIPANFPLAEEYALLAGCCRVREPICDTIFEKFAKAADNAKSPIEAKTLAQVKARLRAVYAYGSADKNEFLREAAKNTDWFITAAQAEISRKEIVGVEKSFLEKSLSIDSGMLFLFYIAEMLNGSKDAEKYFNAAVTTLSKERELEHAVELALLGKALVSPTPEYVLPMFGESTQKRIAACAFGLRFPSQKQGFFASARKHNFHPGFPKLLLDEVLNSEKK